MEDAHIITLVIESHGRVIDLINHTDENVRLIHRAGTFQKAYTRGVEHEKEQLDKLKRLLRKDITSPTIDILNEYAEEDKKSYTEYINRENSLSIWGNHIIRLINKINPWKPLSLLDTTDTTQLCDISPFLRFDKMYGREPPYKGSNAGFHIISIHHQNNCVYPLIKQKDDTTNLIFIENWKPLIRSFNSTIEETIMDKLKQNEIDKEKIPEKPDIHKNITTIRYAEHDIIFEIKLSYLIELLRDIIPNAKFNIIDNTCSNLLDGLSEDLSKYQQYSNPDIEALSVSPGRWGGKRKKQSHSNKIKHNRKRTYKNKSKYKK